MQHTSPDVLRKKMNKRYHHIVCTTGKKLTVRDWNVTSVGSCEKPRARVEPKTLGHREQTRPGEKSTTTLQCFLQQIDHQTTYDVPKIQPTEKFLTGQHSNGSSLRCSPPTANTAENNDDENRHVIRFADKYQFGIQFRPVSCHVRRAGSPWLDVEEGRDRLDVDWTGLGLQQHGRYLPGSSLRFWAVGIVFEKPETMSAFHPKHHRLCGQCDAEGEGVADTGKTTL
jgi:hypothetical protein